MVKKFYLETHGCQMNVHDSEKAFFALSSVGYEETRDPLEADLILLNTCMVREKPEQKVFRHIEDFRHRCATTRPGRSLPVFGVMGCVAQAEAERIFERSRDVRLVMGTQAIGRLPSLLEQLEQGFPRAIDVALTKDAEFVELDAASRRTPQVAYLSIIEGCNKFCSFCIVPYTRGRERSRPAARILAEAKALAAQGFQEIQLLGQNVNSYGLSGRLRGNYSKADPVSGELTFAQLLDLLARESGVPRIKFTTSHPRDFDQEVVRVMDEHENLCEWVHLPVQAGSDRVLRMMRRGYTRADYLRKIEFIKNARKDISLTTDIIIGFPGETEEDFQETLRLAAEVEYDGMYIFNYSPRPKTPAAAYADSVPAEVKAERFQRLQEIQAGIQQRRYRRCLGREVEVLVEGTSQRSAADLTGHTRCNKVVNFPGDRSRIGQRVMVEITEARQNSLYGRLAAD
ncbi:MAG TPA: tRNA (N6-isopentenyl adenosine(37)-C2)-methylthiotransferase MiaB [Blastocatellia bacterium]|nr:tRNA (N6-isopentenyl adenosine(37)-C2)-methylthiotransferase MiaB [Blastocatellia bacterium]